jgi:chromobox protein 1
VTAKETLEAYFKKIGGRPQKKEKKSRKRKTEDVETPKNGTKGRKKAKTLTPEPSAGRKTKKEEWKPPLGSWENHILSIDTIEEVRDESTDELIRHGYVVWNDGTKTRHTLSTLNSQAPQKVRLRITSLLAEKSLT